VTRLWPFVLLLAGIALGILSTAIARSSPGYSFAGDSDLRAAVELAAGWTLLAAGLLASTRRRRRQVGLLLVAASFAWFLAEWNNPGIGSRPGFTAGLLLYALTPALVAHVALTYPSGRLSSQLDRIWLAVAYVGSFVLLGLLPALVFDPIEQGCGACPDSLFLVRGSADVFESSNRIGIWLGLAWSIGLVGWLVLRFVRATPALRRLTWPVLASAVGYLVLVAYEFAHSLERGTLGTDVTDRRIWLAEGVVLLLLALALAWAWLRTRRIRRALARLAVDLSVKPLPGGLRGRLAQTLGDPSLEVAYPLRDGRCVDADGRPVAVSGEVTQLVRGGQALALLSHRQGLLSDPQFVEEVAAAARLVLENERLQAESRAQLADLRASRSRIVETGDNERRRLERDLHDGAQQRLVGLSLSLRLARSGLGPNPDPALLARIDKAEAELRSAFAELRDLAHGLFPAVLTEEGLAVAVEDLADGAPVPLAITALPAERFEPSVEAAAYFVVSEIVRRSAATALTVCAERENGRLVVLVESDGEPVRLVEIEDRVGALDGTVELERGRSGRVTLRAVIPCES
jgi:signal transduction histidine kinase